MKMRRGLGERFGAFWVALIVLDIVCAIMLTGCVLNTPAEEDIVVEKEPIVSEVLLDTVIGTPSPDIWTIQYLKKVDENDKECLAHIINAEAGTEYATQEETDEMQRAVGSVVLNRTKHPWYPDTIEEVIFQKGQYSTVNSGAYYKTPSESAYRNAEWLLLNGSVFPDNVIYQANFKQGKVYEQIKGVYFGYKEEK